MTVTTSFLPAADNYKIPVSGGVSKTYTVVGLPDGVGPASDWSAPVRRRARDSDAEAVETLTITTDENAGTVTVALSAPEVEALVADGDERFEGRWHLRNSVIGAPLVAGKFTIDRNATAGVTSGASLLTVTESTSTLTVTSALDLSAFTSSTAAISLAADRRRNMRGMRPWHRAYGRRTAVPADALFIGDSITEGWSSGGGTAPLAIVDGWFGETQRMVTQACNPNGRHGFWSPAGAGWFPVTRFSANGSATETASGLSLRGRVMQNGDAPATQTAVCDRILVHWRKRNVALTANIKIKIDGVTVLDTATYDGSLPAFGSSLQVFDSGALPRGAHTLSVEQANGAFTGGIVWDGAYFCDGDYASGVRLWNASHFGYLTTSYTSNTTWRDALSLGHIKPGLVVISLGTNDSDATTWATNVSSIIAGVWADADTGGYVRPSIAILIQPAAGSKTHVASELFRTAAYAVALSTTDSTGCAGVDVWEWNELQGDVSSATGDPMGLTSDNVHPQGGMHRTLGAYVAHKMLENLSPLTAAVELQRQIDALSPWHVSQLAWLGYHSTTNATPTITPDSATIGCAVIRTTSNLNEEMVWKVPLTAGTWTLTLTGTIAANSPILTCTLDGPASLSLGTTDFYSAGTVKNTPLSPSGGAFTITTPGVYSFKVAALSKNASSSAYIQQLAAWMFKRTA